MNLFKALSRGMASAALLIALWVPATALHAQQTAKVVSTCGTASGYVAGSTNYQTVDTNGNSCGASGAAPSGTQNVNVTGINGAAPSLTNPFFIAFAEAGDTTGTFTNATQTTSITATNADGYATALVSINGTYGTASGVFEASDDSGTTFYSVLCVRSDGTASETGYSSLTNTNRQWYCPISGNDSFRVRSTAVASGTVNARISISAPPTNSALQIGPTGTSANQVQGTSAAGATDDGSNPLKIGALAYTIAGTLPTYLTGQRGALGVFGNGSLIIGAITDGSAGSDSQGTLLGITSARATSASATAQPLAVAGHSFNGSQWERNRSILNTAATGLGDQAVAEAPHAVALFTPGVTAASTLTIAGTKNRYIATLSNSDTVTHYLWVINTTTTPTNATLTTGTASGNVVECGTAVAGGVATIGGSPFPFPYSSGIYLADSTTTCNAASPVLTLTSTAATMTLLAK